MTRRAGYSVAMTRAEQDEARALAEVEAWAADPAAQAEAARNHAAEEARLDAAADAAAANERAAALDGRPARLPGGAWGVAVELDRDVEPGESLWEMTGLPVRVVARSGKTWTASLDALADVRRVGGRVVSLWTTERGHG